MSSVTTYATISGHRVGLTPTDDGQHVAASTSTRNLGLYSIERFGPDPLTGKGRLTARAVRMFSDYLTGASR